LSGFDLLSAELVNSCFLQSDAVVEFPPWVPCTNLCAKCEIIMLETSMRSRCLCNHYHHDRPNCWNGYV